MRRTRLLSLLSLLLLVPGVASAHAFGQRFDLPVPLQFYEWGAIITLVVSFVLAAVFLREPAGHDARTETGGYTLPRWNGYLVRALQIIGLLVFELLLTTAWAGSSDPLRNLAPTAVWIDLWVGLPFLFFLLGDVWGRINPWRALSDWLGGKPLLKYPKRLGSWPAALMYFGIVWLELVPGNAYLPRYLGVILGVYFAIVMVGIFLCGPIWIEKAEVFTVLSRVIGAISPLEWGSGKLRFRLPGVGIFGMKTEPGLAAFILAFIAGVSFDGFKETQTWLNQIGTLYQIWPSGSGVRTIGLLGFWAILAALYLLVCTLITWIGEKGKVMETAAYFAPSLIPIAFVYLAAHYFTYLLITGQSTIALASDPFGWGSNIFGTASFQPNIGLISVKTVWYIQVVLVLAGHVASVYLSHRLAIERYRFSLKAVQTQLPMLLLMISLTVYVLWVLSAQLVGS